MKIQQNIRYLKIKQMPGCVAKCSSFIVKPMLLWFTKFLYLHSLIQQPFTPQLNSLGPFMSVEGGPLGSPILG